jgi:hypothetical protein
MIDDHLFPRLIEVNLFPSLGGYTHLDVAVKYVQLALLPFTNQFQRTNLMVDVFNLACIPSVQGPVYEEGSVQAEQSAQKCLQDYSKIKNSVRSTWSNQDKSLTPDNLAQFPEDVKLLRNLLEEVCSCFNLLLCIDQTILDICTS